MSTATTAKATRFNVAADKISGRFTVKNLPSFELGEATKPLFAVVGVADLALEQVKEAPALYVAEVKKAQGRLSELPAQVKSLRNDVETRVEKTTEKATDFYAKLAVRGERLVTQIRRQPATEAAIAEGKEAVRKAAAATTAAKKSVKAAEKSVEDVATKLG